MLKWVTAEAIISLYSYCIKMSPINERWHHAEINYTGLCPLSTITCPFLSPFLFPYPLPSYLHPHFLLEETFLLSSRFLLNFILPVYFYFLLYLSF